MLRLQKTIDERTLANALTCSRFSLVPTCSYRVASRVELSAFALAQSKHAASAFETSLSQLILPRQPMIGDGANIQIGKREICKKWLWLAVPYQMDWLSTHGNCGVFEIQLYEWIKVGEIARSYVFFLWVLRITFHQMIEQTVTLFLGDKMRTPLQRRVSIYLRFF